MMIQVHIAWATDQEAAMQAMDLLAAMIWAELTKPAGPAGGTPAPAQPTAPRIPVTLEAGG